jgi:putative DNA primase/helicase
MEISMTNSVNGTELDYQTFPGELKLIPNWVVWRLEKRFKAGKNSKPTKVPYEPKTGQKAKSNDSGTWATFEVASAIITQGNYNGIGFVFTTKDGYLGVDIDHCRDPNTGVITDEAQYYIDKLYSYTEVSPSKTGVHVFTQAKLPNTGRRKGNIEFYNNGRYFTVTGWHLEGTPLEVYDRQQEIDEIYQELFGEEKQQPIQKPEEQVIVPSSLDVFELIRRAQNDNKFQSLFSGNTSGYNSASEADLALCCKLAFYTQGDFLSIDKFFRISGLFRTKWDEKHGTQTYGNMTIIKALQFQKEYYSSPSDRYQPVETYKKDTNQSPQQQPSYPTKGPTPQTQEPSPAPTIFNLTDTGNAERFAQQHGHNVRYCEPWKKWLVWDGCRWKKDNINQVLKLSKETVRNIYHEAAQTNDDTRRREIAKHALNSEASNKRLDMLKMVKAEDNIPVEPHQLDTHPWLLNLQNGTLDLRNNELAPHRQDDYQTYYINTPYNPKACSPNWIKFLNRVTNNDTQLMDYLQKAIGYCLTGNVTEQCLFFLYGTGQNGKTTFVETLQALLGEYAISTSINTLLAKNYQGIPNDIASLKGARLVVTSEVPEGKRLNESLVKDLTGGDTISARFMHADFFNFKPQFKLFMFGNHKPVIHGTDEGIWRRMRLIPFTVTITQKERDEHLAEKLINELPGILTWAIEGCALWQRYGLGMPDCVRKATASYRDEMDAVGAFIAECCVVDRRVKVTAKNLYEVYLRWCEENGEKAIAQRRFGMSLTEKGFENGRGTKGVWIWLGIGLLP